MWAIIWDIHQELDFFYDIQEHDDELKLPYRRRTFSAVSRHSTASISHAATPTSSHDTPLAHLRRHSQNAVSSPAFLVSQSQAGVVPGKWKKYHTFHCSMPAHITMSTQQGALPLGTADGPSREQTSEQRQQKDIAELQVCA